MKTKLILLGLLLIAPVFAVDSSSILLMGKNIEVDKGRVAGDAHAIGDKFNLTADAITYDSGTKSLKCDGNVTIQMGEKIVRSHDCVIELGSAVASVYYINPNGITLQAEKTAKLTPESGENIRGEFHLPKDFDLRRLERMEPNKALEPTPTAVTPPAGQESRQP